MPTVDTDTEVAGIPVIHREIRVVKGDIVETASVEPWVAAREGMIDYGRSTSINKSRSAISRKTEAG
jgi:hypothetical protein